MLALFKYVIPLQKGTMKPVKPPGATCVVRESIKTCNGPGGQRLDSPV